MEVERTKTLAEIGAPFSSKPARSQPLMPAPGGDRAGSGTDFLGSGAGKGGGLKGEVLSGGAGAENEDGDGFQGVKCLVDGDSSVLIKNDSDKKLDRDSTVLIENESDDKLEFKRNGISLAVEVRGSKDSVKESKKKYGVKEDEGYPAENREVHVKNVVELRGTTTLKMAENDSGKELEVEQNGVPPLAKVCGWEHSVKAGGKKCGFKEEEGSFAENGGDTGANFVENPGSIHRMGGNGNATGRGMSRRKVNDNGKEESEEAEEDEAEGGDEDMGVEAHDYHVGDFVWGKIRSHPWWPGQIYDPSDASDYARKYNLKKRLLVAYFGDGSFSWCLPSQLQHFAENFEEMSRQSNSKNFVNAVQKALNEVGRLVESKVTCSCIPEETRSGLARPLALNGGIKKGVLVPECDLSRLSIPYDRPAELMASLRHCAGAVSGARMLELTVLRSWLSAFYRAIGGHNLSVYREPQRIYGLEDENRTMVTDRTDFNVPEEVLNEVASEGDWLSSPVHDGFGQTNQSSLKKCPGILEDKLFHRRKKKSMAELMKVDEPNYKGSTVNDVATHGKEVSSSGKKKGKGSEEAPRQGGIELTSTSEKKRERRRKTDDLGSPKSTEHNVVSAKDVDGGGEGKEETEENKIADIDKRKGSEEAPSQGGNRFTSASGKKRDRSKKANNFGSPKLTGDNVLSVKSKGGGEGKETEEDKLFDIENTARNAEEESETVHSPRERKKSKYLSPPFTSLNWWMGPLGYRRDWEAEAEKIAKLTQVENIGSTSISQNGDETLQAKEHDCTVGTSVNKNKPSEVQKIIDPADIKASTKDVVSAIRSAALNPIYLRKKNSIDIISSFISTFRNALYVNGSFYDLYHKQRPSRKRKSLNSEPEFPEGDIKQTGHELSDPVPPRKKRNEKKEAEKSGDPKLKQSGGASGNKKKDKDIAREATTPVNLIVTFPPGFSLPSKSDLVKIFSQFGPLNETETDVLYNSYCARVVFVKGSDAEEAFKKALKNSPFGSANVNFRLRYPKGLSPGKQGGKTEAKPSSSSEPSTVDEASRLLFIKQKLETMTLMLEKSNGNLKSNLEGEMKGLLEEVSAMANSTSSLKD